MHKLSLFGTAPSCSALVMALAERLCYSRGKSPAPELPRGMRYDEAGHGLPGLQGKAYLESSLVRARDDVMSWSTKVHGLRETLRKEQEERASRLRLMTEQVKALQDANFQLQQQMSNAQGCAAAPRPMVASRPDVVAKALELDASLRELERQQHDRLYRGAWNLAGALRGLCSEAEVAAQVSACKAAEENTGQLKYPGGGFDVAAAQGDDFRVASLDAASQQALKQRLQSLGDVVVYANSKFEACAATGRPIPPGALRIRPRRCDHVFLIESLMPYWAEGICPVCRCSFALGQPHESAPASDDCDRYSSVSTSISQVASGPMAHQHRSRREGAPGHGAEAGGDGRLAERRCPQPHRGRSVSPGSLRRSSPATSFCHGASRGEASSLSHGYEVEHEPPGRSAGGAASPPRPGDRFCSTSPSRSGVSAVSHGSSGGGAQQSGSRGRPL